MGMGREMAEDRRWENEQKSLLRDMGERVWLTKDGREIAWRDMTESHLRNTASFIERNYRKNLASAYTALAFVQGEIASFCIDQDIASLENKEDEIKQYARDMMWYADNREAAL